MEEYKHANNSVIMTDAYAEKYQHSKCSWLHEVLRSL